MSFQEFAWNRLRVEYEQTRKRYYLKFQLRPGTLYFSLAFVIICFDGVK